ncbi:MAG: hypothetical protein MK236_05420 [Pedosphaera sp.]|nr:hypothetical protein [Pedosphaera sp.]
MSQWKVILATLLIFGSGIGTGLLLSKRDAPPIESHPGELGKFAPTNSDDNQHSLRPVFFRSPGFLDRHLDLTAPQKEQVQSIMETSRERIHELSTPFRDQLRQEQQDVQKALREILTPEQAKKFDNLPRYRFLNEKAQPSGRPSQRPGGASAPSGRKGSGKTEKPIEKKPAPGNDDEGQDAHRGLKTV